MHETKIKVPKQIHHWAQKAGLRSEGRKFRKWRLNWKGHGRRWRVNVHGQFQASERYETFDRWANSTEETWGMPQYWHEFESIVKGVGK